MTSRPVTTLFGQQVDQELGGVGFRAEAAPEVLRRSSASAGAIYGQLVATQTAWEAWWREEEARHAEELRKRDAERARQAEELAKIERQLAELEELKKSEEEKWNRRAEEMRVKRQALMADASQTAFIYALGTVAFFGGAMLLSSKSKKEAEK